MTPTPRIVHRCIHCGEYAERLDRVGWCPRCQHDLAYGSGAIRQPATHEHAALRAQLVLDRCRFRQSLAGLVG